MSDDPRTADELREALTRARSTNDYLIEDVVRLKEELAERAEEIAKLKEEVNRLAPQYELVNSKPLFFPNP